MCSLGEIVLSERSKLLYKLLSSGFILCCEILLNISLQSFHQVGRFEANAHHWV